MLSALNDIQVSITRVNDVVQTQESSFIGPVAFDIANQEKLTLMIQGVFHRIVSETVEVTQPVGESPDDEDPAVAAATAVKTAVTAIALPVITAISERLAEKLHSSIVSDKHLMESAVQFKDNVLKTKVRLACESAKTCVAEAIAHEKIRSVQTERGVTNMRIKGFQGKSEIEARNTWLESYNTNLELYTEVQRWKVQTEAIREQQRSKECMDSESKLKLTKQQIDAMSSNISSATRKIYEAVSDFSGDVVQQDTSELPALPMPAQMSPPDSTNRKEIVEKFAEFLQKTAVIKRMPLVAADMRYMVEAVDPSEAIHLLPPDKQTGWVHKVPSFSLTEDETPASVRKDFEEERKKQWTSFFTMATTTQSCGDIGEWVDSLHTVGQHMKEAVNLSEHKDGMQLMWVMLAQLVDFNAASQREAVNTLNSLHHSWELTKWMSCIESWRQEIRKASTMGVVPTYELSLKPAMQSIQSSATNMYSELARHNLTTSTVVSHPHFDRTDCSRVFHDLLSIALTTLTQAMILEDATTPKKRKFSAFAAGVTSPTRESRTKHAVKNGMKDCPEQHEVAVQIINAIAPEDAKMPVIENLVGACMLTLQSKKRLTEPVVRKAAKSLKGRKGAEGKGGDSKGGKSKGGKSKGKGGKAKGKGGRGKSDSDGSHGDGYASTHDWSSDKPTPICQAKGCKKTVNFSKWTDKYYQYCWDCEKQRPPNDQNAEASQATVEFQCQQRDGSVSTMQIDANAARLVNLAQGGATFKRTDQQDTDPIATLERNNQE